MFTIEEISEAYHAKRLRVEIDGVIQSVDGYYTTEKSIV